MWEVRGGKLDLCDLHLELRWCNGKTQIRNDGQLRHVLGEYQRRKMLKAFCRVEFRPLEAIVGGGPRLGRAALSFSNASK